MLDMFVYFFQNFIVSWISLNAIGEQPNDTHEIIVITLVFLGSIRSGSSSLNLELEPELEPAHFAVFRTRTEPEPMILELELNPNFIYGFGSGSVQSS